MVKVGGVEGSKEMPALGTALVVKDSKQKTLFSTELWWWTPRNLTGHALFNRVDVPSYTDWVADLTLMQFVDLNRQQIQSYGLELWKFKEDIEAMTAQIRNGALETDQGKVFPIRKI
ncbi:hypothetical protein [Aurantimicrobium minutum]|nr:hypothetical protein [Aurantimicrobium minutum]